MKEVYIAADNIISSLGFTTDENMTAVVKGITGIRKIHDPALLPVEICASMVNKSTLRDVFAETDDPCKFTLFEQLLILSVTDALKNTAVDVTSDKTLLIVSTTKGSIDVLENSAFERERLLLWKSAQIVGHFFGNPNSPLVISNACISGLLAIIRGAQLIRSGVYDSVIVTGADLVTSFVASGFQSFMALSDDLCRPFDRDRKGLNLGEGAASVILVADKSTVQQNKIISVGAGFSANDATHISAPSRTGEGLNQVILNILNNREFPVQKHHIDFISAHGTATIYNDEMEAFTLNRTELSHVPVNSFKGYWGHTLGAAGIIEAIASLYSMKENLLIRSAGYSEKGTTHPVNVIAENSNSEIHTCLKLASGFGGCNAGVILSKKS